MKQCLNCNNITKNKYCSLSCNNKHYCIVHRQRINYLQSQRRLNNKKAIFAKCTNCLIQFVSTRSSSKYCNKDCYNAVRRSIRKTEDFISKEIILSRKRYLKMKADPIRKLKVDLRCRINSAVKGNFKSGSAIKDLGCSIEYLKKHLEAKFEPGMNWENRSIAGWHIDHIKPLSSFNLTNPKQFKQACHYSNLQPLWAYDNLRKGAS